MPLVLIKWAKVWFIDLNLPSLSNYWASLAFSKGLIVQTSGKVAKAPANPFVKGLPSVYFLPKNF